MLLLLLLLLLEFLTSFLYVVDVDVDVVGVEPETEFKKNCCMTLRSFKTIKLKLQNTEKNQGRLINRLYCKAFYSFSNE